MEDTPWAPATQQMYLIAGAANEEFDIRGLRDRIRAGQLMPHEEIAVVGTDTWKPAEQYPALVRYFALAQKAANPTVGPAASAAPAEAISSRILPAFAYPFTGLAPIILMVLGFATAPNVGLSALLSFIATVYSLAMIRASAEGQKSAPPAAAVGSVGDWVLDFLRIIAVALISAWAVIAALVLFFMGVRTLFLFPLALVVMLLYYPACLIAVAKWRSLSMALSVRRIFGLISTIGADYYVAVALMVVLFIVFGLLAKPMEGVIGALPAHGVNTVATVFTQFCSAHLLGWAVYRHKADL
ncbi:MAG TPA: hypothetical protein VLV78_15235 [Thermoanaerobaculia bacterium]|nr:hypothetical protein [Thermoanaerobaculia bacterium]